MLRIPDYYFPAEDTHDVPMLLPNLQLKAPVMPIASWGSQSRKKDWQGLYHFYIDDYRFSKILKSPEDLIYTGCKYATEPNITVSLCHPRALVVESIFWKRWVNRVWQSYGVSTSVDVNMPSQFESLCFLGVPNTWKSFSTRGYANRTCNLHAEFAMCQRHSTAADILFMVFGGGQIVNQLCADMSQYGWVYVPDFMEMSRGRIDSGNKVKQSTLSKTLQTQAQVVNG